VIKTITYNKLIKRNTYTAYIMASAVSFIYEANQFYVQYYCCACISLALYRPVLTDYRKAHEEKIDSSGNIVIV